MQSRAQSLSPGRLQPEGQQPSPLEQVVTGADSQRRLQPLPTRVRVVHALEEHEVGQSPSQRSPGSTTPLPHIESQSPSLVALQPEGQHPSPPVQLEMSPLTQRAVHSAALP